MSKYIGISVATRAKYSGDNSYEIFHGKLDRKKFNN